MPYVEKSENGNVVFVSSAAALASTDDIEAYSIMKSALSGVNKVLSQQTKIYESIPSHLISQFMPSLLLI